jgi:RNA polymerase sigma factor (sigma-70 family)
MNGPATLPGPFIASIANALFARGWQTRGVDATANAKVIESFRAGDDDGVRSLYRDYGRLVFTIAYRILGDRQQAEDATQQTFVQAWQASASFDAGREIAPWLATIVRRVAIDMQRSAARRPSTSLESADASDPALITMPPSEESVWDAWQVRAAVDELAPAEREVVRLQHLEGYSHSEIGERLNVALGTVKSRSFRAHQQLAAKLKHLRQPIDDD